MGGFGSIQSMNTIMKNNRALLGKRKSMFSSRKEYISSLDEKKPTEFVDHITASPELLKEIRNKLLNEKKVSFRLSLMLFLLIVTPVIGLTFYFFTHAEKTENSQQIVQSELLQNTKTKKDFLLLIKDGDEWMETGHFENALFRYKSAAKLIPNQFDVQYRICLGYAYLCRYENINCEEGKTELDKAISDFPDRKELTDLTTYY